MARRDASGRAAAWDDYRRRLRDRAQNGTQDRLTDPPRRACAGEVKLRRQLEPSGPCTSCGQPNYRGAGFCGRRTCAGSLPLWLGDQRQRIMLNLLLGHQGDVWLVTLTGPGADRLPWDPARCTHAPGDGACSGKRGCRVRQEDADRWNSTADRRWSLLHDAAAAAVRRKHGAGALALLTYSCELHARGVLHWHLGVGVSSYRERAAAHHYVNNLHRLAGAYGYGFVDRGKPIKRGRRVVGFAPRILNRAVAATYLSKYLVKEQAIEGSIGGLVLSGGGPRRPVYVARRLTARTRCTMRNMRLKRAVFMRTRQTVDVGQVEAVWAVLQVFPSATLEPMATQAPGQAP